MNKNPLWRSGEGNFSAPNIGQRVTFRPVPVKPQFPSRLQRAEIIRSEFCGTMLGLVAELRQLRREQRMRCDS